MKSKKVDEPVSTVKQVDSYKIIWNAKVDEGTIMLHTTDGSLEHILVDSAPEASLVLHMLRHETPIFYQDGLLFSGFEDVG